MKTIYHIRLLFLNFLFIFVIVLFFLSKKTALIKTSEKGHVEVVKTLCDHDADLNIQDEE